MWGLLEASWAKIVIFVWFLMFVWKALLSHTSHYQKQHIFENMTEIIEFVCKRNYCVFLLVWLTLKIRNEKTERKICNLARVFEYFLKKRRRPLTDRDTTQNGGRRTKNYINTNVVCRKLISIAGDLTRPGPTVVGLANLRRTGTHFGKPIYDRDFRC